MRKYDENIITAFAMYTRTVDLMAATGKSKSTIVRYKEDSKLLELAEERRLQIVKGYVYKMQSELTKCVDTLVQIRDNKKVNPQTRIYACNCIMNHCREWTETIDILQRLEALERREDDG